MGAVLDGGEVHLAVLQDAAVVVVGVSYPAAVAAVHALQQGVVQGAVAGGRALIDAVRRVGAEADSEPVDVAVVVDPALCLAVYGDAALCAAVLAKIDIDDGDEVIAGAADRANLKVVDAVGRGGEPQPVVVGLIVRVQAPQIVVVHRLGAGSVHLREAGVPGLPGSLVTVTL